MHLAVIILTVILVILITIKLCEKKSAPGVTTATLICPEEPHTPRWPTDVPLTTPPSTNTTLYTVILEATEACPRVHKLFPLFGQLEKDFEGLPVVFKRSTVCPQPTVSYPRILKIRQNGDMLEYTGYTDYAAIADWIRNESTRIPTCSQ